MTERRFMGFALIFLVVFFMFNIANAEQYARTYGGISASIYAVDKTGDNGFILGGMRHTGTEEEPLVVKLSSSGDVQWVKTYGRSSSAWVSSVHQTTDGNYVAAGFTYEDGGFFLKLDPSGNVLWKKKYYNVVDLIDIQQISDGYIIAGYTYNTGNYYDILLLKLDSSGNIQWGRSYGGGGYEYPNILKLTADGGYIVGAYTYSFGAGKIDSWLLKFDSSGNIQWQKTYGGTYYDKFTNIQELSDGYIVVGQFGTGQYEGVTWVLKLDKNGDIQWQKKFNPGNYGSSIIQTTGGYLMVGSSWSGLNKSDIWIAKLDLSGNILWQKTYGGGGNEGAGYITQFSDGDYLITGWTSSFGLGSDIWILKVNSNGDIPNCVIMGTANATVSDTNITPNISAVSPITYSGTVSDLSVIPKTFTLSMAEQCSYPQDNLVLITPNGGNVISSGSDFNIMWNSPTNMVKFNLKLSIDGGATWLLMDRDITGNSYNWSVPTPGNNKRNCLIKVIGYGSDNVKLGADRSDRPFTIEVVRLTYPDGGEVLKSRSQQLVAWTSYETRKTVSKVKLLYTLNGGITWKTIATLTDLSYTIPGEHSYLWEIPSVLVKKTKCRVRVVLKDSAGNTVGSDVSDGFFTITP